MRGLPHSTTMIKKTKISIPSVLKVRMSTLVINNNHRKTKVGIPLVLEVGYECRHNIKYKIKQYDIYKHRTRIVECGVRPWLSMKEIRPAVYSMNRTGPRTDP